MLYTYCVHFRCRGDYLINGYVKILKREMKLPPPLRHFILALKNYSKAEVFSNDELDVFGEVSLHEEELT